MDASPAQAPSELDAAYRRCREPLLERARVWFPTLRGSEQDLYQTAWASVLGSRGPIEDVEKYLEAALYSAGLKELRRRRRRPVVSLAVARFKNGVGTRGAWQEGLEALTDRTEPLPEEQVECRADAELLAELLDELTPLQRTIIKLRWGCGLRRREAASHLGVSEKTVKREMEKAEPLIRRNVALARAGRWCEPKESLVVAYTLGLLSARRAASAREHLERCPSCRAVARAVRNRMNGLAAALPLPALTADASSQGLIARAGELVDSIRGDVTDIASGAKGHTLALITRTPAADAGASQVALGGGLRGGGSALAAVTACLVAGGGATYCALEGVPDSLHNIAPIEREHDERASAEGPEQRTQDQPPEQPQAPISPAQGDPVQDNSNPAGSRPDSQTEEVTAEAQPSPAPKGSVEYGAASTSRKRPTPASAPSSGGGEFAP